MNFQNLTSQFNRNMNIKIIFTSFFALFTISLFSQEFDYSTEKPKINESSLYGGIGITPLYGNFTVNYEILLVERPNSLFKKRGLRVGTGIYQYYDDGSLNLIINYSSLTGTKNNHFELGLGAAYLHFLTSTNKYFSPAVNIGYRFKKTERKFIFRTGIGFPELLYIGFGYAFN